ncbi:MAG: EI24 domain-containing protein [Amnibacterium sp.]
MPDSRPNPFRELGAGVADLGRGFAFWGTSPRLMLLGALPAAIVGLVFLALLVGLVVALPAVTAWATPFADGWAPGLRDAVRLVLDLILLLVAGVVLVLVFTAVVLAVGDPFYERISRAVEVRLGDAPGEVALPVLAGMLRALGEGLLLALAGLGVALLAFLAGLIPVAGPALAIVVGLVLGGRLLVLELTGAPFAVRGLRLRDRRLAARRNRMRVLGFGAAASALFLVPFAPVVLMPAAVAGATVLARRLLPDAHLPLSDLKRAG